MMNKDCDSGLLVLRKEGEKPPLFCIHGGGGDALDYEDLANALPEDQPVYAFSLPTLKDTDYLLTVYDLAALYLSQIRNIQRSGPYQLCGHSFGGFVAYEIACRLIEDKHHVGLIALFDTKNPASHRNISPASRIQFHIVYLSNRFMRYGKNLLRGKINEIIADAIAALKHRGSRFAWKAARTVFQNSARPVPSVIRSDAMILNDAGSAFNPREYRGEVVLFRASVRDIEYSNEATLGWAECVSGRIHVQHVEGDHSSIMFFPNVRALANMLVSFLAAAYDDKENISVI